MSSLKFASKPRYSVLQCGDSQLPLDRVRIMGVLNVTPDSFSDGGRYTELDRALFQVEKMIEEGADMIDVGGESTRPGAAVVSEEEELQRVVPVVDAIKQRFDTLISVDTSTASVMTEAAHKGAHFLNDVRALSREGALEAAVKTGLPVGLMHMQGQPQTMQAAPLYKDVVADILGYLQERMQACETAGIVREQILLDPGFGFGKTAPHNFKLLNDMEQFHQLGQPLLIGMSRKTMIGAALGHGDSTRIPPEQRLSGSLAAATIAAMKGAAILRVHDVAETRDVIRVVEATLNPERLD